MNEIRVLTAVSGSKDVFTGHRIRVSGRANMTLLPDFFLVEVYNPSDLDIARISENKTLAIRTDNEAIVCSGEVEDVYKKTEGGNEIAVISLSDGQSFWSTGISKSVGPGAFFSTTVSHILENALMGSYLAPDGRFIRGQAFVGRLADFISDIAKGVHARAFISNGVLHIVEKGKSEIIVKIPQTDVLEGPFFADGVCLLRTKIKGWPVGMLHEYDGKRYRLASQEISADNWQGNWQTELTLVDEDYLDRDGMDGG